MGASEMGVGEMGVDEMGVGEMEVHWVNYPPTSDPKGFPKNLRKKRRKK
jgi:hypothetical protein